MAVPLFNLIAAGSLATAGFVAAASQGAPTHVSSQRYLYYLHGKIIEDMGIRGVSPRFGLYDYPGIIAAFKRSGFQVVSEVRQKDTDPSVYANKVVADIRDKIASGVLPSHITVVGASKGSVIAALVSTRLREPQVRYVLLANCNDWLIRTWDPRFTGEVLSIYEQSDDIGSSCAVEAARSHELKRFSEVRLNTGLGHGVVYRPFSQWVRPAVAWAMR